MNKCINCGMFLSCDYAAENIEECKMYTPSNHILYCD